MEKARVLFVCIGNSCRSQMAEAFARAYGSDVMIPASAGLAPADIIAPLTKATLQERNISMETHFPKDLSAMMSQPYDLVVNISGYPLPPMSGRVIEWDVRDPIGLSPEVFREVATEIERLVSNLIFELRMR